MSRPKNPLDILQSMVNGILIETGKALRGSDKEGGRTLANANTRLRATIPSAIDNFHQALDDLESDIIRAKAVLLRDLEELRSKRIAAENPPMPIIEPVREPSMEVEMTTDNGKVESNQPTPQAIIKEERQEIPESEATSTTHDPLKETIAQIPSPSKGPQTPSPLSSSDLKLKPEHDGLGINTTMAAAGASPPHPMSGVQDSSIDSLFDAPDNENNASLDLQFDDMDFLDNSSTQHNPQNQNSEFNLSTFGNNPQDFNMTDIQGSTVPQNTNNTTENTEDDLFGMINNSGGDDLLDFNTNIRPAEENSFDEMFFTTEENGGGTEFDDAFFGLS